MLPIKLYSILTTNPKSGASCSLRCLIYKVHAAWRSSDRLPLFKPFVKNFFQVFSNFFQSLSSAEFVFSCNPNLPARLVALASDLHIIAPQKTKVNTLYRVKQHKESPQKGRFLLHPIRLIQTHLEFTLSDAHFNKGFPSKHKGGT